MASFQPAAHVGNPKRWREDYRGVGIDEVWAQIEAGAGTRLPWAHLQMGDARCNRSAYGVIAAGRWFALLDDRNPRDLRTRDRFLAAFGGMDFERPQLTRALALLRVTARHPAIVPRAVGWALRFARRAGASRLLTGRPRALTFVVHAFHGRLSGAARVGGDRARRGGRRPECEPRRSDCTPAPTRWPTPSRDARFRPACSTASWTPPRTSICSSCCLCTPARDER